MDFADDTAEWEFRARLRDWLTANDPGALPHDPDERHRAIAGWHRALAAAGYVGLSFPDEDGGAGLPATYDAILNDEIGRAGLPPPPAIHHLTNAIRIFGTEEQRREHLPAMLSCATRWCQGFSEPDAGSDLASLRTRAVESADGATFRITGSKIWTSDAVWSDWCLLLCRTDGEPDDRHRGRSMVMVPLDTAGITRRPLVTASGTHEFAEVVFDGAVVPTSAVLGRRGGGWEVAMQLLAYERGPSDIGWVARMVRRLTLLEADVDGGRTPAGPAERRSMARARTAVEALQAQVARSLSARLDGSLPGPEGSLDKLLMTEVDQLLNRVETDVRGAAFVLDHDPSLDDWFWSRAQSVFGGTQQIQRDIVAQRVLGLPRSAS